MRVDVYKKPAKFTVLFHIAEGVPILLNPGKPDYIRDIVTGAMTTNFHGDLGLEHLDGTPDPIQKDEPSVVAKNIIVSWIRGVLQPGTFNHRDFDIIIDQMSYAAVVEA
jgi:hypothetical protein